MNYQHAKLEADRAYQRYNYASAALKLAQIQMRLAELHDQHEPLASRGGPAHVRDKMYAAAFYAVVGRWPE